ncbi:MAG: MiaB/RimO family radical SAM methylthiotransferase [Candidatus Pacebacteria bacterium]|nr:MiaB/RimO family radical SAM methylthiotransferase [Candidatus Paceibacterota bacterium]
MKYHIITFGCQMNKSDSERIATVLETAGYKKSSSPERANLVIVNFCSVRQAAVDKALSQIQKLKFKSQKCKSKVKIVATGCILKADKKKLAPIVNYILSIKNLAKWPKILSSRGPTSFQSLSPSPWEVGPLLARSRDSLNYLKIKPSYKTFPKAFVPISFGCNNFCTYCVVPYTRGQEIHRKEKEILDEIKNLIAKKYNHTTLLGENVNSYPNFVGLLQKITAIKGNFRVNFMAANPHNFNDELIKEIAKNPKLEKYLHLPLQSGDNAILKTMKRPYTASQYIKLIAKIKKQIPGVKIVTDIIVGFPGETKKAFQNTVNVFNKVGFYQAYISKYSPRPGTAAFFLKDTVPTEEKSQREQRLIKILHDAKSK